MSPLSLPILFFKRHLLEFSQLEAESLSFLGGVEELTHSEVTGDSLLVLGLPSVQSTRGHMITSKPIWGDDVDKSI